LFKASVHNRNDFSSGASFLAHISRFVYLQCFPRNGTLCPHSLQNVELVLEELRWLGEGFLRDNLKHVNIRIALAARAALTGSVWNGATQQKYTA
jgi:hypothetical protein